MSASAFRRNFAIIIGINNYQNNIRELKTAVPDALKLAEIIQTQHEALKPQYQSQNRYEVQLILNQRASLSALKQLITDFNQGQISLDSGKVTVTKDDRLLFYFAGHGIALDALESQEGPVGYLIPQDAKSGDSSTYLPMQELHDALNALPCRHLLAILDCCFAGAFRWASLNREILPKVKVYKERYDRFISDRAWQVITSAADDQKALDSLGSRGIVTEGTEVHSPFAKYLFDALQGKGADLNQDGMITATELYSYLRDRVEIESENYYQRQTPSLCPLRKHDKGEFIFLLPEFDRNKLEDAPSLNVENNPYRGLSSYDEKDSHLFFGREEQIQKLYQKIVDNKQQLTLVLGASGTGKSSLVKAGLIPKLSKDDKTWHILPPFRPGESPLKSLNNVLESVKQPLIQAGTSSRLFTPVEESLGNWFKNNPQAKLLVVIDQFEELITLSKGEEAEKFQIFIKNSLAKYPNNIHVVITLRLDFEAQFQTSILKDFWNDNTRFVVPPMTQDEFREVIEKPALQQVVYFDPPGLVDELINEVVQMPGALPLLSFTLSELYLKYLEQRRDNRALTKNDYEELGRVVGSLTKRANQEYDQLVMEDPAYKDTVRHVMLRMISPQGRELARRQVPKSELVYVDKDENRRVQRVIKCFSDARLIVEGSNSQDKPYVEPAHDALVQGWDKLLEWKKQDEENIILQRRLTPAAEEWNSVSGNLQPLRWQTKRETVIDWLDLRLHTIENLFTKIPTQIYRLWRRAWNKQERFGNQPVQFLWNGNPYLDIADKELNSNDNWLNQVETEFVQKSVLKKRQNIRWWWRGTIFIMSVLSGLTAAALIGQRQALIEQIITDKNSTLTFLNTNQPKLDALISSLRAEKSLNNWLFWGIFQPDKQLQNQVRTSLKIASYALREQNRWQLPQAWTVRDIVSINEQKILVAATDNDNNICVQTIQQSQPQEKPICRKFSDKQSLLTRLKFSPDTKKLIISESSDPYVEPKVVKNAYLWDLKSNHTYSLLAKNLIPDSLIFSPDSKKIALIDGKTAYLWDWRNRKVNQLKELQGDINGINFKPNGTLLVATVTKVKDGTTVDVLDYSSGQKTFEQNFQKFSKENFRYVIISNNGQLLAINYLTGYGMSQASAIFQWTGEGQDLKNLGFNMDVTVSFSPDGKKLAITQSDGTIQFIELDSIPDKFKEPLIIKGSQGFFSSVNFTPNDKQLLTASKDNTISIWNLEPQLLPPQTDAIELPSLQKDFSFSPDGQQLALLEESGNIRWWDLSSNQELKLPSLLQGQKYSEESKLKLILSSNDKQSTQLAILEFNSNYDRNQKIHVWDLHLGKERVYNENYDDDTLGSFSPDGKQLAITNGSSIYLLNLMNNKVDKDFSCDVFEDIKALTWTNDGKLVIATIDDDSTKIWEYFLDSSCPKLLASLKLTANLGRSFSNSSGYINLNTDDKIANITYDGFTILWHWESNIHIKFDSDSDNQYLSPDNKTLLTLDNDKIKYWKLGEIDTLIQRDCEQLRSYLDTLDENNSDRHLCDGIKPSQLTEQTQKIITGETAPVATPTTFKKHIRWGGKSGRTHLSIVQKY
ncbi:caspase family protein [Nostocaceae cyanobacterium CENA369]|uniref:Caspase family protein n=1 Tax=Dendronalium phyllosphericum CENA369 TaxID=1725256 RepID=A0A8J7LIU1_9NOST|nr:caspase family protein [Dendronalium phyllosphericum]MBH8577024.1 caspase family protein [Dendronalium phyllosphericum CENA369]